MAYISPEQGGQPGPDSQEGATSTDFKNFDFASQKWTIVIPFPKSKLTHTTVEDFRTIECLEIFGIAKVEIDATNGQYKITPMPQSSETFDPVHLAIFEKYHGKITCEPAASISGVQRIEKADEISGVSSEVKDQISDLCITDRPPRGPSVMLGLLDELEQELEREENTVNLGKDTDSEEPEPETPRRLRVKITLPPFQKSEKNETSVAKKICESVKKPTIRAIILTLVKIASRHSMEIKINGNDAAGFEIFITRKPGSTTLNQESKAFITQLPFELM